MFRRILSSSDHIMDHLSNYQSSADPVCGDRGRYASGKDEKEVEKKNRSKKKRKRKGKQKERSSSTCINAANATTQPSEREGNGEADTHITKIERQKLPCFSSSSFS